MDTDTLFLLCWVYGKGSYRVFPVQISRRRTVASLKRVLKQENLTKFDGVDANDLTLYAIPTPDEEHYKTTLEHWVLEGQTCLDEQQELSMLDLSKSLIIVYVHLLTFSCWVRGDTFFSVDISSTRNVAALKEMIKSRVQTALHDVTVPDARDLSLYKVVLPCGEGGYLKDVGARTISSLGEPMENTQKLSDVVKPLSDGYRQCLIVDGMSIPLECWIRGAEPELNYVPVNISMDAWVSDLENKIKMASGRDLPHFHYKLYKIPVDEKVELNEYLNTPGSGRFLGRDEPLRNVFADDPLFRTPRVVAESSVGRPVLTTGYGKREREDALEANKRIRRNLAAQPIRTPSIIAMPSCFVEHTGKKREPRIRCGRLPQNHSPFPLVLGHYVFATFVSECQTYEPSREDIDFVRNISHGMHQFGLKNKFDQRAQFRAYMSGYGINLNPTKVEGTEYFTAGDARVGGLPYLISVVKKGVFKEDPYIEAAACHVASIQAWFRAHPDDLRPLPCMLIVYDGPFLLFAGSMLTDAFDMNVLGTVLPLCYQEMDMTMQIDCAKAFGALKNAANTLKKYYEQTEPQPFVDARFPWITQYDTLASPPETREYRYLCRIDDDNLVFVCQHVDDGTRVIVKFVQTYSKEAHLACAARGGAPALLGYQDTLPRGWSVVVIELLEVPEWVSGVEIFEKAEQRTVRDVVREQLLALHQQGYVHGDVRAQNIIVRRSDAELGRSLSVYLINFDWAGKINEAKYPGLLNSDLGNGFERPNGVKGCGITTEEHDLAMLDLMYYGCSTG